jgi:hypothetical protein
MSHGGEQSHTPHQSIVPSIESYLIEQGYEEIQAVVKGYEDPPTVRWKDQDHVLQPDIVAYKGDRASVFLIEDCENISRKKVGSKWKLMYKLASKKGGEFCLIIPEGKQEVVRQIVKELQIEASCIIVQGL